VSAALVYLSLEVATIVCAALLGARVLASGPGLRNAQLIALIAFCLACGVVLGHQEYGYWMPPAFRIDVGGWAQVLNLARNMTPGLIMLLCFSLFTDGRRFPRWLLVLLAVQLGLEEPGRSLISPAWRYARIATQTAPALHQPILLIAAFWLFPLRLALPEEILLLTAITVMGSLAVYEAFIRPFAFIRFLFGLKPKSRSTAPRRQLAQVEFGH
jgi:hypothetical protein